MTVLGRYPALAGVDLDVSVGEVVLLSGPNGAGKTTLLRLLAGLAPLTGGSGTVLGHDLRSERTLVRARVAMLGHETFCYEDLSARDNLRFQARAAGRSVADADTGLERVGLTKVGAAPHRLLSAGQRRRVALGVVVVRAADLLLLDEPHAGLDAAGRSVLESVVAEATARGASVVMASHELERARPMASREVALAGGHVGTPDPGSVPAGERSREGALSR